MKWYWSLLICIWTLIILYELSLLENPPYILYLLQAIMAIYFAARLEKERFSSGLATLFFGLLVIPVFLTNLKRPKNSIAPWLYKDSSERLEIEHFPEEVTQD